MTRWIPPREVARRRIIEDFACEKGKGKIVCNGRTFNFTYDDVLDLAQMVETLMLKLTGKLLQQKFRPSVMSREPLVPTKVVGGDYSLYAGSDQPLPPTTVCEVTRHPVKTHYLLIEIQGNVWHNWFGRLDELAKCLYNVVREAQGDEYKPEPAVFVGSKGAIFVPGAVGNG